MFGISYESPQHALGRDLTSHQRDLTKQKTARQEPYSKWALIIQHSPLLACVSIFSII